MSYRAAVRTVVALMAGGVTSACDSMRPEFERDGLRAVLSLEPGTAAVNQQFDVRVDLINRTDQPISLQTRGCYPLTVSVSNGPDGQPGASPIQRFDVCVPEGLTETIPPAEQITLRQPLMASSRSGMFDLRVDFNFHMELPELSGKLQVE